jgi:transcriptional regulator with XRE-family HTH domain
MSTDDLVRFAEQLKAARTVKGWTIADLSTESGVSPQTIVALEAGKTRGGSERSRKSIRMDVVLKLARALERSDSELKEWLRLAGHYNFRQVDIERFLARLSILRPGLFSSPPGDPLAYFQALYQTCKSRQVPAIMCVCYTSEPAAAEPGPLHDTVISCVSEGLWIAMTCPYPKDTKRLLPSLDGFYAVVRNRVVQLAKRLGEALDPSFRQRIAVFAPSPTTEGHLVAPPLRMVEYRPALTHFPDKPGSDELGVWLRTGLGAPDRWVRVNPQEQDPRSDVGRAASDAVQTWREYFDDIIKAWDGGQGWKELAGPNWVREIPPESRASNP